MNRLKELRKEKKLTQEELAQDIGVSKITILRWENGERQIKPEKAQQLADYFGVSVGYLLGYEEAKTLENILKDAEEYLEMTEDDLLSDNYSSRIKIALSEMTDIPVLKNEIIYNLDFLSYDNLKAICQIINELPKKEKSDL
ncbi:HTH-type transcriptional regulator Xre [Streptococcus gordonii]|nr:helix-turn-helix domain-containing protein [Streptococcus gordonii]RSJ64013.1 HTH-type transcriptional regulator Xre [Streptococcus gordonii]